MKKIFTLFAGSLFALFTNAVLAQVTENFNTDPTLTQSCFINNGFTYLGTNKNVSINSTTSGVLATPYIDIPAGATISAFYNVVTANNFNGAKTSKIEIGIVDKNGTFSSLTTLTVSSTTTKSGTISGAVNAAGTYRVQVRVTESATALTTYIDDMTATSTSKYHYSSVCNSAPKAANDEVTTVKIAPITVDALNNDSDPNQPIDKLSVSSVSQPVEGKVTVDPLTNTVTFTPAPDFEGGPVTFSYTITDNGYTALTSTATVTINYPIPAPVLLPVKLVSFQGTINKEHIQLQWSVAENETADRFEVEKSTDGKNFTTTAIVMSSNKSGYEGYQLNEAPAATKIMYRLKMFDKAGVVNYSKILSFQSAATTAATGFKVNTATSDKVTATITATIAEEMQLNIYDLSGKLLQQQKMHINDGQNMISVSLNSNLKTGIYVAELSSNTQHQSTKFFIQ